MTDKKENILKAALQLFSEEGFGSTSTSRIAKAAGVSEGLIFRHFGNKDGLLNAILKEGEERAKMVFANIVLEADPKQVIAKTIDLPFVIPESEHEFWRLQFKLKWETNRHSNDKMEPLKLTLVNAFSRLGYSDPEMEADFLLHFFDGIAGAILRGQLPDVKAMQAFLHEKYNV